MLDARTRKKTALRLGDFAFRLPHLLPADIYDTERKRLNAAKKGKPLTPDQVKEEMAAEVMLDVLDTEENLREIFKGQDKGLIEKIKNWLENAAQRVRQAINDLSWNHPEVRALKDDADYFQRLSDMFKEALRQAGENYRMSQRGLYDSAKADPDVQAYLEAVKDDITQEAAAEEADALARRLFTRAAKDWIAAHMDEYEQGFEKFKEAMKAFGSGNVGIAKAFQDQGLDVPEKALFPVLGYAGRQMVSAEAQAEKAGSGTKMQYSMRGKDGKELTITAEEMEENKKEIAAMPAIKIEKEPNYERFMNGNFIEEGAKYFAEIGGKAENEKIGTVELVRSGLRHIVAKNRLSEEKAKTLCAIKPVIENGRFVEIDNEHKGKAYDTAVIAGKVELKDGEYLVGVVVSQHNGGTKGQKNNYSFHSVYAIKSGADRGSIDASSVLVTSGSAPDTISILRQIAKYKWENSDTRAIAYEKAQFLTTAKA